MTEDVIALAWRAEEELLTVAARSDSHRLTELLASDFYEIGQSGRRWSRDEIIAAVASDSEPTPSALLTEHEALVVGPEAVLLSYRLRFGSRIGRRSALWRWDGSSVECVFHQGTSVPTD